MYKCLRGAPCLRYILKSGVVESYGKYTLSLWRYCQSSFQSGFTILHSFYYNVPGFWFHHILINTYYVFPVIAIAVGVKWYLIITRYKHFLLFCRSSLFLMYSSLYQLAPYSESDPSLPPFPFGKSSFSTTVSLFLFCVYWMGQKFIWVFL